MMGRDGGEQIWLRQAATFTVNDETRTVEIAVPLRPGATDEEIEELLREAEGGMERLTRHLDARVAALRGAILTPSAVPALPIAPPQPAPPAEAPLDPQLDTAATIAALRERTALTLAREASATPPPEAPQPTISAQPVAPQPTAPRPITPQPAAPLSPSPQPSTATQPVPRPAAASAPGTPLTLQEFLKETQDEFGFTPRTVMEKLGVRSLSGVNYREAIETLRRQAIRDGSSAPTPPSPNSASAAPRGPSAASGPRYFEEELDEPEIVFSAEDDEDMLLPDGFGPDDDDDEVLDALDLEEEIAPPPPPPTRTASAARARTDAQAKASAILPAAPAAPVDPAEAERTRIAELVAQLRSPTAGGVPSSHQRTAYRNIVVQELGEEKAKALVAGLYRVTPERLGPEQIDTLLSWGKRDTFADDSALVLAALRAERAAQQAANSSGHADAEPTTPAPTPRATRAPRA